MCVPDWGTIRPAERLSFRYPWEKTMAWKNTVLTLALLSLVSSTCLYGDDKAKPLPKKVPDELLKKIEDKLTHQPMPKRMRSL